MILALDVSSLNPLAPMGVPTVLIVAIAVACVLCVALAAAAIALSRPRRTPVPPRGAHATAADSARWHRRVDDVVARYEAGAIGRPEAFAELAAIVRAFASEATGQDMRAHTLSDFSRVPRASRGDGDVDLLRQTVAALYPPEFADGLANAQAGRTGVAEAAGWVSNLVDRWR